MLRVKGVESVEDYYVAQELTTFEDTRPIPLAFDTNIRIASALSGAAMGERLLTTSEENALSVLVEFRRRDFAILTLKVPSQVEYELLERLETAHTWSVHIDLVNQTPHSPACLGVPSLQGTLHQPQSEQAYSTL